MEPTKVKNSSLFFTNVRKIFDRYFLTIIVLNTIFFYGVIFPNIRRNLPLPYDTYRDIACGQSILNGNSIFRDPAVKGQFIWYPPLNALVMAMISRISGASLFTLYAYSPLVINYSIPILFYIFIMLSIGKRCAFWATLSLAVMPWLKTHLFSMAMPSIHSFAVVLTILIIFYLFLKKGLTDFRSAIMGILAGLCLLHHSISGLILVSAISLYTAAVAITEKKPVLFRQLLIILGISGLLWGPFIIPNLLKPKLNYLPIRYFAPELTDLKFVLFYPNKYLFVFFILFFLAGLTRFIKNIKKPESQLILSIIIVTVGGQVLGYLNHLSVVFPKTFHLFGHIPYLVPHEFQWYFQLFGLIIISDGFLYLGEKYLKNKEGYTAAIFSLLVVPAYAVSFKDFLRYPINQTTAEPPKFIRWVENNTAVNSVFLLSNNHLPYFILQPYTARPIIYQGPGHMNYNVDVRKRLYDKYFLLYQATLQEFQALAKKYEIEYILIQKNDLVPERMSFFDINFVKVYEDKEVSIFKLNVS